MYNITRVYGGAHVVSLDIDEFGDFAVTYGDQHIYPLNYADAGRVFGAKVLQARHEAGVLPPEATVDIVGVRG